MRVAHASVCGIPRADVAADSLIVGFFRSQSLQDGSLHIFPCVCQMGPDIEENEALQAYSSGSQVLDMLIEKSLVGVASCGLSSDNACCRNLASIARRHTASS